MPTILARLVPALIVAGVLALAYFGSSRVRELASELRKPDRTTLLFIVIISTSLVVMLAIAALTTK
jgi:amino acid transporter